VSVHDRKIYFQLYFGIVKGNFATVLKIQKALEAAGICFTDDAAEEIGVRLDMLANALNETAPLEDATSVINQLPEAYKD
jgi:hypothetical protein